MNLKNLSFYLFNLILIILFALILSIPYFGQVNQLFVDQLHGAIKPREEIVIIGIDDQSLSEIGAWPWSRDVLAKALKNLNDPKVVGVDVLLLEERSGDEDLSNTLQEVDFPVVLASKLLEQEIVKSKFQGEKVSNGYINFNTESDGKIRRTEITKLINDQCLTSFSLEIFTKYLNIEDVSGCNDKVSLSKSYEFENKAYFSYARNEFQKFSFIDLYNGEIDPDDIKNKIILIGSTARDLKSNLSDNFISVFGDTQPGIEIHANIINSFLENRFFQNLASYIFFPLILAYSIVLLYIYKKVKNNWIEFFVFIVSFIVFNLLGIVVFDFGINWPFLQGSLLLIVTYIYMIAYKYLVEQAENRFVKKAFSQYINPKLLKKLVEKPERLKLGGEKKVMTVLFSDIRKFTGISEKLSPEKLINLLNQYFEAMSDVILRNNGTIDKYIGDGIMAFWNAPVRDTSHVANAIKTAVEMQKKQKEMNTNYVHKMKIGIGVNTGEMIVGNIGSRKRFDYTVLGDNVNLGSRLEGLTKKYGVNIIVSDSVWKILDKEEGTMLFRLLDKVLVKGRKKPVEIYEVMNQSKRNKRIKQIYEEGFCLYQKGKFREAKRLFNQLKSDRPSKVMIERMGDIKPTRKWDGVWQWVEK